MNKLKYHLLIILFFITLLLLGLIAMIFTYALPNNKVKDNINRSIKILELEGTYKTLIEEYKGTTLDNFTDALILSELYYDDINISIIEKAMRNYGNYDGENPLQSLINEVNGLKIEVTSSYERYWHGNLIILKPLFMIFDYNSIRILNIFLQSFLIISIIILMKKNNLDKYMFTFIITLVLINPFCIPLSLQYSSVFYITLIGILILLIFKNFIKNKNLYPIYFMILGMLTSYFDLLTYPLISLGLPLIFTILLEENSELHKILKNIFVYSLLWGIGYAGMWISKWFLGSILLNENLFLNAFETIKFRTSVESFNRLDAIIRNFSIYTKPYYIFIFICVFSYFFIKLIINYKYFKYPHISKILPFVIIASMPIVWYIALSNHSYIHYWFTYRSLSIFFFSSFICLQRLFDFNSKKDIL